MNYEKPYSEQDTCLICGRYIPEGWGMICINCEEDLKENDR